MCNKRENRTNTRGVSSRNALHFIGIGIGQILAAKYMTGRRLGGPCFYGEEERGTCYAITGHGTQLAN